MKDLPLRRATRAFVALSAMLIAGACNVDNTLRVPDPDVSRPPDVSGAAGLPTLLATAVGDFQVAFSGTGGGTGLEGLINMTGLMGDEFAFAETFPTRVQVDRRSMERDNSTLRDIFFTVQRARASALRADSAYAKFAPTDSGRAEALALEGYSYVLLAETYCSGVPTSSFDASGHVVGGEPLTTTQLLDTAIDRFTRSRAIANALTRASTKARLVNLASVGQARALMFKGTSNNAAAAALVAAVPTTFEYFVFSSSNTDRQNNGIYEFNWAEARWTQSNREGIAGLPYRQVADAGDPRTDYIDTQDVGFDGETPWYVTLKYSDRDVPSVLASGIEARLIEAENLLAGGSSAAYLTPLNTLRATISLPALADPGTPASRVSQFFAERAYWLFLTAHRLGDMRRLIRSTANGGYGLAVNSVYPNGPYPAAGGGQYGTDVNFPIPIEEDNNPKSHGCIDRNP